MANQLKLVATIGPANTAVEASIDNGVTWKAVAMTTNGSQQEGLLVDVAAGTYPAGTVKLRSVAFPAVVVSEPLARTVLGAASSAAQIALNVSSVGNAILYAAGGTPNDFLYAFDPLTAPAIILPPSGAVKLSTLAGLVSDADISSGSSLYGTNNTAVLQSFFDSASGVSTSPLVVDWDVKVSHTGLKLKSYTKIYARAACGAILLPQSNSALFENKNKSFGAITDTDIGIYGPGIWNHNAFSGAAPPADANNDSLYNQAHSSALIGWCCPIRMYGVNNFTWDGGTILRQRTFAMHLINTNGLRLRNGVIDSGPNAPINTDGIHMNGHANDFEITNWQISAHDDKIALSPNDSIDRDVHGGNSTYYAGYAGNMTNGLVDGVEFTGGIFGVRVLSGANAISNVTVRNLYGKTKGYWLVMDNFRQVPIFDGGGPGFVNGMLFENIFVQCENDNLSYTYDCAANINCNAQNVTFRNVYRNTFSESNFPSFLLSGSATTVTALRVENYHGHDVSGQNFATAHVQIVEATVNGLAVQGQVSRTGPANASPLVLLSSGNLSGLVTTGSLTENSGPLFVNVAGTLT